MSSTCASATPASSGDALASCRWMTRRRRVSIRLTGCGRSIGPSPASGASRRDVSDGWSAEPVAVAAGSAAPPPWELDGAGPNPGVGQSAGRDAKTGAAGGTSEVPGGIDDPASTMTGGVGGAGSSATEGTCSGNGGSGGGWTSSLTLGTGTPGGSELPSLGCWSRRRAVSVCARPPPRQSRGGPVHGRAMRTALV